MNQSCVVDLSLIPEIPHVLIDERWTDGKDMTRKYPGHYVTVRQEGGATYHVSKPGPNCLPTAVLVAEGRLYRDGYDPLHAPKYKNTRVLDFFNNREYIYDGKGDYRIVNLMTG